MRVDSIRKPCKESKKQGFRNRPLRVDTPPYYYFTESHPTANFPHSMENQYFPMKSLMIGPNSFNFSTIDTVLMNIAKRNHHAIVRVYVDWPGEDLRLSVPDFLWDGLT